MKRIRKLFSNFLILLRLFRIGFGYPNRSAHKIRIIQFSNRFANALFLHFYKAKTFRFLRFSVIDQLDIKNFAKLTEKLLDLLTGSAINQIPYINVFQDKILR